MLGWPLRVVVPTALLLGGTVGCVTKARYDAALADAQAAHAAHAGSLEKEKADQDALARLQQEIDAAQADVQDRDLKLSDLTMSDHNLQARSVRKAIAARHAASRQ